MSERIMHEWVVEGVRFAVLDAAVGPIVAWWRDEEGQWIDAGRIDAADEIIRLRGLLEEVLDYADQQIRDFETYILVDDNTLNRIRQALHREEGEEVCGESFDHDLRLIDERDGWRTYECRVCGAEVSEEDQS